MALYAIMKLLILLPVWMVTSTLLLIASFYLLASSSKHPIKLPTFEVVNAEESLDLNALNAILSTTPTPSVPINTTELDSRVLGLQVFLKEYNSPLSDYSHVLVREADNWGLDYTLIPAIAMQESGGCNKMPKNSYNCWGYATSTPNSRFRFSSYPEAIQKIAKTLKESYINKGYDDLYSLEKKWTSYENRNWSHAVYFFMSKILHYEYKTPAT